MDKRLSAKEEIEFLKKYNPGDYEKPSVTADVLVFTTEEQRLQILLVKRGQFPYKNYWAIPGGFVSIEESAFEEASLSGTVTFNTNATVVFGDKAFFKTKIRKLSLPNIKRLPYSALSMSYNLEELHFNKVEVLGFGAIGWNYLKEINLENTGITEIETVGISGCTELENVILPATIKVIGYDAFWYCQHLKTVTINAVTPPTLVN